jgi:hypothetical protein
MSIWQPNALAHECVFPDHGTMYKRVYESVDYKVQEPLLGSSFTFRTKINKGTPSGISLAADVTHGIDAYLVREINRRCNFDKATVISTLELINRYKGDDLKVTDRTKILSMVEMDIINESNIDKYTDNQLAQLKEILELSLANGSFQLVTIHDEFKCHANYVNSMRKHYNRLLWEFYHSNLLADLIFQISGKKLTVNKFDQDIADQILDANYPIN